MTPARIVIILVALVAAVGLALLVHGMFGSPKPPPQQVTVQQAPPPPPMTRVLVAKVDLGVGDRLSADNMAWQNWPASTLNPAYVTDGVIGATPQGSTAAAVSTATHTVSDMATGGGPRMQAMVGAIVRQPIYAGEPITAKEIVRSGDSSYMAVRLPEGMRAMALPLSTESGAGGFIQPGDHVDVFSTHADASRANGGMITEVVITNALVLAIDQHPDAPKNSASLPGNTITLEVPQGSVMALAKARAQTGLTIALRSYADIGGRPGGPAMGDGHSIRVFKGGGPAELVTAQ
jgi:pilus assembly protein CpaB